MLNSVMLTISVFHHLDERWWKWFRDFVKWKCLVSVSGLKKKKKHQETNCSLAADLARISTQLAVGAAAIAVTYSSWWQLWDFKKLLKPDCYNFVLKSHFFLESQLSQVWTLRCDSHIFRFSVTLAFQGEATIIIDVYSTNIQKSTSKNIFLFINVIQCINVCLYSHDHCKQELLMSNLTYFWCCQFAKMANMFYWNCHTISQRKFKLPRRRIRIISGIGW